MATIPGILPSHDGPHGLPIDLGHLMLRNSARHVVNGHLRAHDVHGLSTVERTVDQKESGLMMRAKLDRASWVTVPR